MYTRRECLVLNIVVRLSSQENVRKFGVHDGFCVVFYFLCWMVGLPMLRAHVVKLNTCTHARMLESDERMVR